jgi:hypothetical protein
MKNDLLADLNRLGVELRFQRALDELREYIIENNQNLGDLKGEIVLKIGVAGRRGEAERGQRVGDFAGFTFTIHDAQIKKPARLGKEIRTYLDGESVVVDPSTVDEATAQIALFHNRNHADLDAE